MSNLICIRECYNVTNKAYKIGGVYKYYDSDFIDMMGIKYYYIYAVNRERFVHEGYKISEDKFGTGRKEFIDMNFLTIAQWGRLVKEIDTEFEKYFYE
jgi:hypothetical protein